MKSHIIPRFATKWLVHTSPGHLRHPAEPNVRVQGSPTPRWLCAGCEQLLSSWERPFAERIFRPVHAALGAPDGLTYSSWALKFAVSVSWRSLLYYQDIQEGHLGSSDRALAEAAADRWRAFMVGKSPHPAEFEQHMIVVGPTSAVQGEVSPFLNRFLLRTVYSDLLVSNDECFTLTKLGQILVLGFLRGADRRWRGGKLHVNSGIVGLRFHTPMTFTDYLNEKADEAAAGLASLSEEQQRKVNQFFEENPEAILESDMFRAFMADLEVSGVEAYRCTGRAPGENEQGN